MIKQFVKCSKTLYPATDYSKYPSEDDYVLTSVCFVKKMNPVTSKTELVPVETHHVGKNVWKNK